MVTGRAKGWRRCRAPARSSGLTEHLANRSHLVVVDGLSDVDTLFAVLENADERVLVYEPTLVSLNRVAHTLALLSEERETLLVENHTRARKSLLSPRQVSHALAGRAPDFTIPFEPKLPGATNRGRPDGSLGRGVSQGPRQPRREPDEAGGIAGRRRPRGLGPACEMSAFRRERREMPWL